MVGAPRLTQARSIASICRGSTASNAGKSEVRLDVHFDAAAHDLAC
jgi:hypothetical protein